MLPSKAWPKAKTAAKIANSLTMAFDRNSLSKLGILNI
jgi:hypothetical protein